MGTPDHGGSAVPWPAPSGTELFLNLGSERGPRNVFSNPLVLLKKLVPGESKSPEGQSRLEVLPAPEPQCQLPKSLGKAPWPGGGGAFEF